MMKKKILKITLIIFSFTLLINFHFKKIDVKASSNNIESLEIIKFDGFDCFEDFNTSLGYNSSVHIIAKFSNDTYNLFLNNKEILENYFIEYYLSTYIPFMSITCSNRSIFREEFTKLNELILSYKFEYVYISTNYINSNSFENNSTNSKNYDWDKVCNDVGIDLNSINIDGNIRVGILEQGLVNNQNEYLLRNNINIKYDEEVNSKYFTDHATFIACLIAEITKNISNVEIYSKRFTNYNFLENGDLFCEKKYDIVNVSFGIGKDSLRYKYEAFDAIIDEYNRTTNTLFVTSTGNDNYKVSPPAKAYNAISVGAIDAEYNLFSDSGYSIIHRKPTIVAPGVNLCNLPIGFPEINNKTGTSFSSAIVSGIIALLKAEFPYEMENTSYVISTIIAGAHKINKNDQTYTEGYGFGIINYESSRKIILEGKSSLSNNVESLNNTEIIISSYSAIELIFCTLVDAIYEEENNLNEESSVQNIEGESFSYTLYPLKIEVYDKLTNELIDYTECIDNIYNLKIINFSSEDKIIYLKIENIYNYSGCISLSIRNYGRYQHYETSISHGWESNFDNIEHLLIEDNNGLYCAECNYYSIINENIITDPNDGRGVGTEVLLNGGDNNGNTITQGFTRLLYFKSNTIPSVSRLDYDWFSSNEDVATVSAYGTVTALSVTDPTWVTITAIYKFNNGLSEIVYTKELLILPDTSGEFKIYNYEVEMNVEDYYIFQLSYENAPTVFFSNYYWKIPCQKDETPGVSINDWGKITAINTGVMYVEGWCKYNPYIVISIKVTVT